MTYIDVSPLPPAQSPPIFPAFFTPASLEELLAFLKEGGKNGKKVSFVAGGTDWTTERRKGALPKDVLCVDLSGLAALRGISVLGDHILIGALSTMTDIAENAAICRRASCLAQAAKSVGSWQIRNSATLGGNLANASPAADTPAALAALDAVAILTSPRGVREFPVSEVPTGPNSTVLEPDELITAFRVPLRPSRISAFGKVGSRTQVTIARLNLAVSAVLGEDGKDGKNGKIGDPRVFVGTLGIAARRCSAAEKVLSQIEVKNLTAPDSDAFRAALVTAVEEAIPGRSTLPYKRSVIQALGLDVAAALAEAAKTAAEKGGQGR